MSACAKTCCLEIDARRDLGDDEALRRQLQHAALGDIGDVLALRHARGGPEKETCSTSGTIFLTLPSFSIDEPAVRDLHLRTGIVEAGEDDLPGARGDVDEAAGTRGHMRPHAELRDIDRARAVDLQEGQQRAVETRRLEIGELLRRWHDRLRIGGAAELEFEQRHAADRSLLDHPGGIAMTAFLEQDARHIGGNAEAQIDGPALLQSPAPRGAR